MRRRSVYFLNKCFIRVFYRFNRSRAFQKGEREDKTEMQYMISKLEKHQYVYFTRENSEETTLEDLFFVHRIQLICLTLKPHSNIMCVCLIPGHFLHALLKEDCLLPPPCKEWMNHKIGEAEKWLFDFVDRQAAFNELKSKEPKPPKKPTNEHNPITFDTSTPEKPNQDFEVMDEDVDNVDYALSLA